MSEFSPLRDPVFVLTWQVHLAVVSLFALLAVWAGMTRRAWYIAPTLFCGLLWLFIPLEAPEPALVLLLAVPCLAVACRLVRPWIETPFLASRHALASGVPRRGWNFRLADLLWLTLIVGMVTSLLMQVWRWRWATWGGGDLMIYWPDLAISAACLSALAIAILVANRQSTWKRRVVGAGIALLLVFTAAGIHLMFVRKDWLLIYGWDPLVPDSGQLWVPSKRPTAMDVFSIYWLSFVQFSIVLAIGVGLLFRSTIMLPRWARIATKTAGCCCLLAHIVGLGFMYVALMNPPGWPEEQWPASNGRPALMLILTQLQELNPNEETLDNLQETDRTDAAKSIAALWKELDEVLALDNITLFDSRYDQPDPFSTRPVANAVRRTARVLGPQAEADWAAGRRAEALRHDLLILRLARACQRRGTIGDALVGSGIAGLALHRLAATRTELTCVEIQLLLPQLDKFTNSREPLELLLARGRAWMEDAGGWHERLSIGIRRLLKIDPPEDQYLALGFKLHDAQLSLLITELAVRCYHETSGRWPSDLQALVPEQLATLPLDPFSGQPLVYRETDDGFVLYSVGRDGQDSGGRFGKAWQADTPDLDLDAWRWE